MTTDRLALVRAELAGRPPTLRRRHDYPVFSAHLGDNPVGRLPPCRAGAMLRIGACGALPMSLTLQTVWLFERAEHGPNGRWSFHHQFDHVEMAGGELYDVSTRLVFGVRGIGAAAEPLRIVLTDLSTGDAVTERPPLNLQNLQGDPLVTVVVPLLIPTMRLPHSGTYAWEVFRGAEYLGGVRFTAAVGGSLNE